MLRKLVSYFLVGLALASAVQAENTIKLFGNVTDANGASVSGAELTVKIKKCKCSDCDQPARCDCCPPQFTTTSTDEGHYSFSVPHGIYLIDAKAGGREAHIEVDLNEGSEKQQDIRLVESIQEPPHVTVRRGEGKDTRNRGL